MKKKPLDLLLVVRGRVGLVTDMFIPERELDTLVLELCAIRNRSPRGSFLVQDVNLFEGQSLGLERDVSFLEIATGGRQTSGMQK